MNLQSKFNQKSKKLISQQIRKRNYKMLGTSVMNSPMSPPYLVSTATMSGAIYIRLKDKQINNNAMFNQMKGREGGDIGLFITPVPKNL